MAAVDVKNECHFLVRFLEVTTLSSATIDRRFAKNGRFCAQRCQLTPAIHTCRGRVDNRTGVQRTGLAHI